MQKFKTPGIVDVEIRYHEKTFMICPIDPGAFVDQHPHFKFTFNKNEPFYLRWNCAPVVIKNG